MIGRVGPDTQRAQGDRNEGQCPRIEVLQVSGTKIARMKRLTPRNASAKKPKAIRPMPDVILKSAEYKAPCEADNPTDWARISN